MLKRHVKRSFPWQKIMIDTFITYVTISALILDQRKEI